LPEFDFMQQHAPGHLPLTFFICGTALKIQTAPPIPTGVPAANRITPYGGTKPLPEPPV